MRSIVYSAQSLTEEEAREVAEAYIKGGKDPRKMASILGLSTLDLNIIMHPLVRNHVLRMQSALKPLHSLEDHVAQLAKIRNAAFEDDNYKVALAAETQLGKAVGHYDPKGSGDSDEGDEEDLEKIKKLSTADLRRKLVKLGGGVMPEEIPALPEPGSIEAQESDEDTNEI